MTQERRLRILIGKAGLDGHDRGAKIIARLLRDSGFEVIYTGLHNTPEMIVETAIEEDVDAIGISILSGAHNHIFLEIIERLNDKEAGDIPVFGGGVIPPDDMPGLREKGVKVIFGPGTPGADIVEWIRKNVKSRAPL